MITCQYIVVQLNDQPDITWVEFQTILLAFESRLDHINSLQNMHINTASANTASANVVSPQETEKKKTMQTMLIEAIGED